MKKTLAFVGCARYGIYPNGQIFNIQTGREIIGTNDRDGYNIVALCSWEDYYSVECND